MEIKNPVNSRIYDANNVIMVSQLFLNSLIAGSSYTLMALGFAVIYRTVGFFHFAHGIIYAGGAYAAYTLILQCHLPWLFGVCGALLLAGLFGVGIDRCVYRPLRRRKASNLVFFISSMGVLIFFQNLFQMLYGAQMLTLRTGPVREGRHFLGGVITDMQIVVLVVSAALFAALSLFITATKLGKAMRAVSDDRVAASLAGIDPEQIITAAFFIGSALAGAAGILISLETTIEPSMGMNAAIKGITASVVGGMGSIPGAAFGGMLLGFAENFGIWKIPASWKDGIAIVILIAFLLIKPEGIRGRRGTEYRG